MSRPGPSSVRGFTTPTDSHFKHHLKCVLALLALTAGVAVSLPARAEEARGRRMYLECGSFGFDEDTMLMGELRWGSVTPFALGVDFALPFGLTPAIVTTPDLDLAFPIAFAPGARLVPRAGASALLIAGGDIAGYAFGGNVGAGLVLNAQGPVVLRVDYTMRLFDIVGDEIDSPMHSVSAGIGWRY